MVDDIPPHFMIVEARFYEDIADYLVAGAVAEIDKAGGTYDRIEVPGALEIPGAISFAMRGREFTSAYRRYDAYITLGCVIRGETSHYDYVCSGCMDGLQALVLNSSIALGNGVLTCEDKNQAIVRADPAQKNKGGEAARAAIRMLEIKKQYGLVR